MTLTIKRSTSCLFLYTHKRRCINDYIAIYYGIAKRKQRLIRLLEFKIVDCYSQLLGNNP